MASVQPTVDEKVYAKLSSRMKDRFDIFGTLPDVIDDDWIDDEERLEEELKNYTNRRARANAFDLRYAGDVVPKGERWELCEKMLARNDVKKRLSRGLGRARPGRLTVGFDFAWIAGAIDLSLSCQLFGDFKKTVPLELQSLTITP